MREQEEIPAFTDAPDESESVTLAELGRELYQADQAVDMLEQLLAVAKERRLELTMRELPEYMTRIGQDRIGLPDADVDLVMEPYYHANIQADWPVDQREKAFSYLEHRGDGDLIKTKVEMFFGRSEIWKVRWIIASLRLLAEKLREAGSETPEIPDPIVSMQIPWNTLTAFVKEQIRLGAALELDTIGATVGRVVKIKPRKK